MRRCHKPFRLTEAQKIKNKENNIMKNQNTSYVCADCGTKQIIENGQAPKSCLKCDGNKFFKSRWRSFLSLCNRNV